MSLKFIVMIEHVLDLSNMIGNDHGNLLNIGFVSSKSADCLAAIQPFSCLVPRYMHTAQVGYMVYVKATQTGRYPADHGFLARRRHAWNKAEQTNIGPERRPSATTV